MHVNEMKNCAAALDEVAGVLEQLAAKYPKVFDDLQVRYPLADELGGFAAMMRDDAKSSEHDATQKAQEAIHKASRPSD